MNTKRLVVSAMVLLLLAGCGGSEYAEEKALLTTAANAMETFNASIAAADAPDAVVAALGSFTGTIEGIAADLKALNVAHPEWQNEPPEELKETMAKFEAISKDFQTQTMPKVMQFTRDNTEDEALKSAVQEFGKVMSQL